MDLENFPYSESAKRMISYLTQGFYEKSYVAKWIFEVMGKEWDGVKKIYDTFPEELFPSTATWTLPYYEEKYGLEGAGNFETRRQELLKKITITLPFNPEKIRTNVSDLSCIPLGNIVVTEYPRGQYFTVEIRLDAHMETSSKYIADYLMGIKPAHLIMVLNKTVYLLPKAIEEDFTAKLISCHKVRSDMILPYWRMISQGKVENQLKETVYLLIYTGEIKQQEQYKGSVISRHKIQWFHAPGLLNGGFCLDGNQRVNTELPPYWRMISQSKAENQLKETVHWLTHEAEIKLQEQLVLNNQVMITVPAKESYFHALNVLTKSKVDERIAAKTSASSNIENEGKIVHKAIQHTECVVEESNDSATTHKMKAESEESTTSHLTTQENLWRMNGMFCMDGEKQLNALEIKEDL